MWDFDPQAANEVGAVHARKHHIGHDDVGSIAFVGA
jgi:hypothetical protein